MLEVTAGKVLDATANGPPVVAIATVAAVHPDAAAPVATGTTEEGAEASAVLLVDEKGGAERVERGAGGYFKRVFQKNKWLAGRVEGSAPWLAQRGWERAVEQTPALASPDGPL